MITKKRYIEIKEEIEKILKDTFDELEKKCPNELIAFLARGEYNSNNMNVIKNALPYNISNNMDIFRDMDRVEFFTNFLNSHYSFKGVEQIEDDVYRIHIELMIYCHIWESKHFLKQFSRLAVLNNKEKYEWNKKSPANRKFEYIRDNIKRYLNQKQNLLSQIVDKGYHSSLRNAFAHSDYSFNLYNGNKKIVLNNYGGKKWEIRDISFDEWSERFVYSILLCYSFLMEIKNRVDLIPKNKGYVIKLPNNKQICIEHLGEGDFINCQN